jgi:hypothetical protein
MCVPNVTDQQEYMKTLLDGRDLPEVLVLQHVETCCMLMLENLLLCSPTKIFTQLLC